MKNFIFFIATVICFGAYSQTRRISITVDDIPSVTYGLENSALNAEITEKLILAFDKNKISVTGFAVEGQLYKNSELDSTKVEILRSWFEHGQELGNHTFSHLNFNKVGQKTFFSDILKGQEISKSLAENYGKPFKYFRHPFLQLGADSSKAKALHNFLLENGYIEAPVTLTIDDYTFGKAYHNAYVEKNPLLMEKIANEYLNYVKLKLDFFEDFSRDLFNRDIAHVLRIHANLLNANFLPKIIQMLQKRDYGFTSLDSTLKDEAYKTRITKYSEKGLSWVFLWALSLEKGTELIKNDPKTPEYVFKLAKY